MHSGIDEELNIYLVLPKIQGKNPITLQTPKEFQTTITKLNYLENLFLSQTSLKSHPLDLMAGRMAMLICLFLGSLKRARSLIVPRGTLCTPQSPLSLCFSTQGSGELCSFCSLCVLGSPLACLPKQHLERRRESDNRPPLNFVRPKNNSEQQLLYLILLKDASAKASQTFLQVSPELHHEHQLPGSPRMLPA